MLLGKSGAAASVATNIDRPSKSEERPTLKAGGRLQVASLGEMCEGGKASWRA